ncbi:Transposase for transposon Tn5 [Pannonibacter phragmitetus]|uniref:Transposase for transposon Tn5 n=1 Tax=Pannonibacter phragmitetus TaxID=121719 RepID=A0A378ZYF2_9HYPH|nr:IS4 family transposase [Pannonibacter phragmitetus]SUB02275.1 Transposase for transposon Tn5 [Pannonibacter phragmitetus]
MRITRFLRNPSVSVDEMLLEAGQRTSVRSTGRDVLVIQDTTVVRSCGGGGDYLHVSIALDESDGALLGLVGGAFLKRSSGHKEKRRELPVEEKESFRWLESTEQAASVCAGAGRITVIADREGDIYEAFALRPEGTDLLIRAAQDRSLEDGGRLFAALEGLALAGQADISLPAGPGRRARTARLGLRFSTLKLARPNRRFAAGLPDAVEMQVISLREIDPPAGVQALHWRLLTTRPVRDAAEAFAMADLYRRRWTIEQLFRTLKTQGFDIEGVRIEEPGPRDKLVTAALIAAVAVQQLVHAREGGEGPLRPCTDTFEQADTPLLEAYCARLEGKTERQKNPHPKGSLAYAAWVCARLGGWTGYYGKPGPVVMLQGWLEIQAAKRAINAVGYEHDV